MHPLWLSLAENPPEGVRYRVFRPGFFSKSYFRLANYLPFLVNPTHFCNGAKPLRSKPWVVDLESVRVFFKSYEELDDSDAVNRVLERLEPCKAVLPLSEAAKRTIIRHLGISAKRIEVVYPAIKPQRDAPNVRKDDQVTILFVGGAFEAKGGREVLAAFREVAREKTARLIVVGAVKPKYEEWVKGFNVEVYQGLPREKLFTEIYPKADVFVMPTFMDTVGYVYLEAMAFGIPVIASNHFAAPELVGDAGLIVNTPFSLWRSDGTYNPDYQRLLDEVEYFEEVADALADAMHALIEDPDLRLKLGMQGIWRVHKGPVSLTVRNNRLRRIYEKAFWS
jgi:glycosyltransferase involved in cell wall biosynthesis